MRAVFIGDLQAHAWSQYSRTLLDGMNDRLMDVVLELRRIRELAVAAKIQAVFLLGDIFQERGRLDTMVLNSIYREIEAFRQAKMRVVLLLGNHDRTPVGTFHSLEVFRGIADVIDEPMVVNVDGCQVYACPFQSDAKETTEWLKKVAVHGDVILLHTAVKDIKLPSGETWGDGVPLSVIPTTPWTFMGHFHKFMQLRERCYYVGSLLQLNWGEARDQKVFGQLIGNTLTWVPSQGPRFIEVTEKDFLNHPDLTGNFVRVRWQGPLDEAGAVRSYLLDTVGARAVEMVLAPQVMAELVKSLDDPRVLDLVMSYVKTAPLAERKSLLETGQTILRKAEALEDQSEET